MPGIVRPEREQLKACFALKHQEYDTEGEMGTQMTLMGLHKSYSRSF